MWGTLLLLASLTALASPLTLYSAGLRVKFDVGLGIGTDFFYDVPLTAAGIQAEGWTSAPLPPNAPLPSLSLYCYESRAICALYDLNGNVAGVQVGLETSKFTNAVLDWTRLGFTLWTPFNDGKSYWTNTVYFIAKEHENNPPAPVSSRSATLLPEDALWVTGFNGTLMRIGKTEEEIQNSLFTKQACIPFMGRHYYYNMSADSLCTDDQVLPWFHLVDGGRLIGNGFLVPGVLPEDSKKDWFERPNETVVRVIVPSGPDCLYKMASNPGILTMHIYYINRPWLVGCLL